VALQQQKVAGEVVAPQEFLLNHLILFRQQRPRQPSLATWNIFPRKQVRQGEDLFAPSQLFQQTVQIDDTGDECGFGERWNVRAQFGQPAKNMRITPQLFQAADLVVLSAQVTEKTPEGSVIGTDGSVAKRGGEGLGRTLEQRFQGMAEGTMASHD
jgi:hypothetical protein